MLMNHRELLGYKNNNSMFASLLGLTYLCLYNTQLHNQSLIDIPINQLYILYQIRIASVFCSVSLTVSIYSASFHLQNILLLEYSIQHRQLIQLSPRQTLTNSDWLQCKLFTSSDFIKL